MRLQHHPAETIVACGNELRVAWEVPFEARQQAHAKQIGKRLLIARVLDHREQAAVGRINAFSVLLPFDKLSIAPGELGARHTFPIISHSIDDADFVTILQIGADSGQMDARLNAVPPKLAFRTNARKHKQLWCVERSAA